MAQDVIYPGEGSMCTLEKVEIHCFGRPLSHLEPGQLCALQKEAGLVPADVDDTTGTAKDTRDALGPWGLWGGAGQP